MRVERVTIVDIDNREITKELIHRQKDVYITKDGGFKYLQNTNI